VDAVDDGMEAKGGVPVEVQAGPIGDGSELVFEERGIRENVGCLDRNKGQDIREEVQASETDSALLP
jgi:hypothetical protein